MFDHLILTFYSEDTIENGGVFLSYNQESKSNACDSFAICSVTLPGDYYDF